MYETINDYMENPNMDRTQLNELLIMAEDFRNQSEPLFCQSFQTNVEEESINDLPFYLCLKPQIIWEQYMIHQVGY